jgi:hypothetical protein
MAVYAALGISGMLGEVFAASSTHDEVRTIIATLCIGAPWPCTTKIHLNLFAAT